MNNNFIESDNDIAEEIKLLRDANILTVISPQYEKLLVELLENNFTFIGSKIPHANAHSIIKSEVIAKLDEKQVNILVQEQILKERKRFGLLERPFVVIGDNYINYSYKGILKELIPHISIFISLPQHTYFISEDGKFVFCYTFGNDFLFYVAD